ncbi:DNA methyltransferase [Lactococcus cremoris subsp. cremoris IBB477]|uniref:Cytosine-specific methyltransferase n=1 Tax=Lactococcus cremoris subsp. cremoris IBB477 TaxID=1449093 RepID=A0A1E7G1B9_LACLC|nr:DNA cytosine methyltransferase [Lactococcus cremoris]OEU38754.1 DNA methyltransferase [Lactococcus cremoris subsp. cremoris IBB477]
MGNNIKFIDLFCGIGGIRIGMEKAGFQCVFSSDIDEECKNVYEKNYGERPQGDISQIQTDEIPDFDILCGGFPCQPFSISGKKKGFEDTRGTLFFEICRITEAKQPKVVILENVKHLIHHDGGRTFQVITTKLEELGYVVTWEVLNALDFGVPQNRERIIIVATKSTEFDFDNLEKEERRNLTDGFLDLEGDFEFLDSNDYTLIEEKLRTRQLKSGLIFAGYRNKSIRKVGVRPGTEHLSRVHKQPNRIYDAKGTHPTLPSQETSGRFWVLVEGRVRKLTIDECYRIMGFPDDFKRSEKLSNQYKQIGNSVCVPMFSALAREVRSQLFCGEKDNKNEKNEKRIGIC